MLKRRSQLLSVFACLADSAGTAAESPDAWAQQLIDAGNYDSELCSVAQLTILNARPDGVELHTLVAEGGTFVTEQMNADADTRTVTVAALLHLAGEGRDSFPATMACKLINQDRGRDVLGLVLPSPAGTCRDVNELTYRLALANLADSDRRRYLEKGTPLLFTADYEAAAGGEWLPSVINDFIRAVGPQDRPTAIEIQAPSVQVPWPGPDGDWFEGTHHCKLVSYAAMTRWMTHGALTGATELFPRPRPECTEPSSRTSAAGSCMLYFGPAGAQFCQDYSGSGWTQDSAAADCAIRHSSRTAWDAGGDRYEGDGGIYNAASCAQRDAVAEARGAPFEVAASSNRGTCVFRCQTPDEALWHQLSPMPNDPDGRMLERTCDLFLQIDW